MGVVKRIGCYDANKNVIEPQDDVRRYLTEFKLCDESSEDFQRNLTKTAKEILHDQFTISLKKMKDEMKVIDPSMAEN